MKKWITLLTAAVLVMAFSGTALAASTERLTLYNTEIYNNTSTVAYDQLKMTGSETEKELYIEKGVLDYLVKNKKAITIDMDGMSVSFSPKIFQTAEYKQYVQAGNNVGVRLLVDTAASFDDWKYLTNMSNAAKIGYKGVGIEAWLMVDGVSTKKITKLTEPIKVTFKYDWDYSYGSYQESNVGFYWVDAEQAANTSGKVSLTKMPGTVNAKNHSIAFEAPYGYGVYMPYVSGSTGGGNTPPPVKDQLTGHWAESGIVEMQSYGIVPTDLSKIDITKPIQRGEFTSYLVKTLKVDAAAPLTGKFTDVTTANPYYTEINQAVAAGLITGQTATTFAPNANITRQEMATMLSRALTYKGATVDKNQAALKAGVSDYTKIAPWAVENCAVSFNAKLISGREKNAFAPQDNTAWAEAVVILYRLRSI